MTKKDKQIVTRVMLGLAVAQVAIMAVAPHAHAIPVPTDTTKFGYDFYQFVVVDFIQGPIGYVGGALAMVYGGYQATKGEMAHAVPAFLGGAAFVKADSLVSGLGMIV